MTRKRFWILVACAGVVLFVGGLILTIVLADETGHTVPDSQCDTSSLGVRSADVFQATCVVSDDPKVLLGVLPLLLGVGMTGIGIWRAVVAGMNEGSDGSDGNSGLIGGLMGDLRQLQAQGEALQAQGATWQAQAGMPGAPASMNPANMQTSVEQAQAMQKQAMEMAEKAGILNPDGTPNTEWKPGAATPPANAPAPPAPPPPDPPTPPAPDTKK